MQDSELRLDGNALAGLLGELFANEMTAAWCLCAACGRSDALGGETVYLHAPGAVLRCRYCENVLAVVVRGRDRYWLSLQGLRSLEIRTGP